jgi:hypothetical protein
MLCRNVLTFIYYVSNLSSVDLHANKVKPHLEYIDNIEDTAIHQKKKSYTVVLPVPGGPMKTI